MSPSPTNPPNQNFYAILGLPPPTPNHAPTTPQIKLAFRRALLLHHPDKSHGHILHPQTPETPATSRPPSAPGAIISASSSTPSIDLIRAARDTLTNPLLRREYDRRLLLLLQGTTHSPLGNGHGNGDGDVVRSYPTELESVDLDDMEYDEAGQVWTRACRCGNGRGYEVREGDLEGAAVGGEGYGEVLVGCGGCSLHVRVVFEVVEGEGGGV